MKRPAALILLLSMIISLLASCSDTVKITDIQSSSTPYTDSTPMHTSQTQGIANIIINEVKVGNKEYDGTDFKDWIEIYNRGDTNILLNGYSIGSERLGTHALELTGKMLPSGGYLLVPIDENSNFNIMKTGEEVTLYKNGEKVNSLYIPELNGYCSYTHDGICNMPTPGYENTTEGYRLFLENLDRHEIVINEVMASNSKYFPDASGKCYDYIELYNRSDIDISLGDYYLSDKFKNPQKYALPDVILEKGGYICIRCSGLEEPLHANFKISSGDTIYLTKGKKIVDSLTLPENLLSNISYGRSSDKAMINIYMDIPTPESANKSGAVTLSKAPKASKTPGMYDSPFKLTLSGEGDIYYTLDGTKPDSSSKKYNGEIDIKTGINTLRAVSYDGKFRGEEAIYSYTVGIEHTLPVISVEIPSEYLRGEGGILDTINENIEKEATITLFENGNAEFSLPFGFRLHGKDSRKGKKQSFQIRFRADYGVSKLKYSLFDGLDVSEFDSLILSGGGEDYPFSMIREPLITSIVGSGADIYVQSYKPVVLYLSGEYYGVYYLKERFSDDYVASHLDVSSSSVDLLELLGVAQSGSDEDYKALIKYVKSHDLTNAEYYKYVTDRIDLISLIDWNICRSYVGDRDYLNIRFFRSSETDGKWRWMFFDLDWAFYRPEDSTIPNILENNERNILFYSLMKNPECRETFLKRYAYLMNTILNEETFLKKLEEIVALIEPEMERDRTLWGYKYSSWVKRVDEIRDFFRDGARDKTILTAIKSQFSLSDSEMKKYFGDKYKK